MATCYISEYTSIGSATPEGHANQAPKEPAIVEQSVPIQGSASSSSPFGPYTKMVMISLDSVASIRFGGLPAQTNIKRLPANFVGFFEVNPSDTVSVITNV